ncbi:hypothetical protein [uncultured Tateyamaria sp.]|uniref:hypothetical protein n=1 Tax=uncultured Tateyamaria sp. TaxID=455651 RepID=UPI00263168A9|nr:hypothetical protein [uncultured Tateyamaria sp.]
MDLGPGFALDFILAVLFYLLYVLVPLLGVWLWRKCWRIWVLPLGLLWCVGFVFVPLIDHQRARLQAEAMWGLAILPDSIAIDGKVFVSDDTVRTPHTAIHRFNTPARAFGLYNRDKAAAALAAGPVDFADLRFFEHVPAPGEYKDRKTVETPQGTRVPVDYLMWSDFRGDEHVLLDMLNLPGVDTLPNDVSVDYAILEVQDPSAFDLRSARVLMLLPYASKSYYAWPFNPMVRRVYSAADYTTRRDIQLNLFCSNLSEQERDRCRRDM